MEDFKFYEVGGKIRDELLGLTNKDVDYVAVPTEAVYSKIHPCEAQLSPAQLMFKALKSYLEEQKFEIFLVTPECYTIRAKFPEGYKYQGVADFVMARKEVGYVPGTRTPIVEPGNLYDDLSRRDFTINALYYNPFTKIIFCMLCTMMKIKSILIFPNFPKYKLSFFRITRCYKKLYAPFFSYCMFNKIAS